MVKNFLIGSHKIGIDPCYIIAEVGSNHDGDKSRALEIIRRASKAGANGIKFQLFKADRIAARIDIPEARLNDQFAKFGKTVYDLYKGMELPDAWLEELKSCCDENRVDFIATPFDEESADKLAEAGVPAIKVASFEITHIPLLKHVGRLGLPVLLSTGMANMKEIEAAVDTIRQAGEQRIALFHCGIDYPAPLDSVHLRCIETMRETFHCPVGYSDHTQGIVVPISAVAMGAALFEKHVTMEGGRSPDHDFAMDMDEFGRMVSAMRQCETALGSNLKDVRENELRYHKRGRRSLFVVKDMREGEVFTRENISVLRPGIGLSPIHYEEVLGKKASHNIHAPAILKEGDWE